MKERDDSFIEGEIKMNERDNSLVVNMQAKHYFEDLETIPGFLNSASDLFEFSEEEKSNVEMTAIEAQAMRAEHIPKKEKRTHETFRHIPTQNQSTRHTLIPDNAKEEYMNKLRETDRYFDDIEKKYKDSTSTQKRVLEIFKKQRDLVLNEPDYLDAIENGDTNYLSEFNSTFMTFPSALFAKEKDGKKVYEYDYEKHKKLMDEMGLLDITEDKQNFFITETLPFYKAKKAGTLTEEQRKDYQTKYVNHLKKHNEMYKKIDALKQTDPMVIDCYTFADGVTFDKNYHDRYSRALTNTNNEIIEELGKGWNVEDVPVVRDLKRWYHELEENANKKPGDDNYNEKKVEEYKKIVEDVKAAYEKFNGDMHSDAERKEALIVFNSYFKKHENNPVATPANALDSATVERSLERNYGNVQIELPEYGIYKKNEFGISVNEYAAKLGEIYWELDKGDSWYVNSSKEFKEMKEEMKRITKAGTRLTNDADGMMQFGTNIESAITKIEAYLEHKGVQLDKDKARKDSWRKSFNEQPRIQLALDMYDKLIEMSESIEKAYIDKVKEPTMAAVKAQLEHEEELRSSIDTFDDKDKAMIALKDRDMAVKTMKANYENSVVRSIDLIFKSEDVFYKRMKNETLNDFKRRIDDAANGDIYTTSRINKLKQSDGFKEMLGTIESSYSQLEGRYTTYWSNGSIKRLYNEKIEGLAKEINAKKQANVRSSRKTNAAEMREKLAAKKAPKKPQAPGK